MNMILFTVNVLIVLLSAEKKSVFRSDAVLENENDPTRKTIYGEFIVFFDLQCVLNKEMNDQDIIEEFIDLFQCYTLNENVTDLYPNTIDHWIYMDQDENCDEDDIEIEWDDYCIIGVEEDEEEEAYGYTQCVSRWVGFDLWNLNTVCPNAWYGIEYMQFDASYNPNMDIIVMDSGIDTSHPQFSGMTIERIFDAYPGQALDSHGTHCAGTIFGKDYGALRINSDTQIKVIDVRIFPTSGGCSGSTILNAYDSIIDYLDQNPGKKVIINMSFGGGNWHEYNTRLASIRAKGGISFAAAGNDDKDASNFSPASSPDTITVGANDKNNNKASFSNYGYMVDIWAPGTSIKSAVVGGGSEAWDGTSMATPLVAGIAANILANNPSMDFNSIKQRLLNFAEYDVNGNLPRVQASCSEYTSSVSWFGSLTSSILDAKSITPIDDDKTPKLDDFEVKNNYNEYNDYHDYKKEPIAKEPMAKEPIESGGYLSKVLGVSLLINICFAIYCCKRYTDNTSKQYKVVKFDSETDIENN